MARMEAPAPEAHRGDRLARMPPWMANDVPALRPELASDTLDLVIGAEVDPLECLPATDSTVVDDIHPSIVGKVAARRWIADAVVDQQPFARGLCALVEVAVKRTC